MISVDITDDHQMVLEGLKLLLDGIKEIAVRYCYRSAPLLMEGLKMSCPDVILLDIMMPNLDGYSTLEEIKKRENLQNTKVIFLSAKNNPRDIEKGLEMGADAYVTKPYSIKKLMQQIEEML